MRFLRLLLLPLLFVGRRAANRRGQGCVRLVDGCAQRRKGVAREYPRKEEKECGEEATDGHCHCRIPRTKSLLVQRNLWQNHGPCPGAAKKKNETK